MATISKTNGLLLRGGQDVAGRSSDLGKETKTKSGRTNVNDDFVIPHVGPNISDRDVLSFAEGLAESIIFQPDRAVAAQANQDRSKVTDLTA